MVIVSDQVLGNAYRSTFAWEILEKLTEIENRMPGHTGEKEAANLLHDEFERIGLKDSTITDFEIPGWWRGHSTLEVETSDGRNRIFDSQHQIIALPGSPDTHVEGEIVDVEAGLPADFDARNLDGKIAFVGRQVPPDFSRSVNRIEQFARARTAGASGFIYANTVKKGAIPPTGAVGFTTLPASIPAVGVSNEVATRIQHYLEDSITTASMSIDCQNDTAVCHNVEAVVGPECGSELLLTSHIDAHDLGEGARDNASGVAISAEVARLLSNLDQREGLKRRVRIIAFGGEETGLYGSKQWATAADMEDVFGQINIDAIGYTRNLKASGLGLLDAFETVDAASLEPIVTEKMVSPYSDHWPFVTKGIPSVTCKSSVRDERQPVMYGGRDWGHTHGDTIDKIDSRDIRDLTIPIIRAVVYLLSADSPPARLDASTVQKHIPSGLEEYLSLSDRNMP